MYEKVFTSLIPEAISFSLPLFVEHYEQTCKDILVLSKEVKQKADALCSSYLKLQECLVKVSQVNEDVSIA
jgi:hypothetical protein